MTNKSILRIHREKRAKKRLKGRRKFVPPRAFAPQAQARKFGQTFSRLDETVEGLRQGIEISTNPSTVLPDRALVFEVIGQISEFADAVRKAGFEWLGEAPPELESIDGEDLKAEDQDDIVEPECLYLTMPSVLGLETLVEYWDQYADGERPPEETARKWWELFGYLSDVRVWSAADRINQVTRDYIREEMKHAPNKDVRLELDLWFVGNSDTRRRTLKSFSALISEMGGEVLDHQEIEPIHYFGVLVRIPAAKARQLAELDGPLSVADMVMSIKPQSLFRGGESVDEDDAQIDKQAILTHQSPEALDPRQPIAALIDGYPIAAHKLLRNRIDIHEVDVVGSSVPPARRYHGTAMASLILHGDLAAGEPSLDRALKIVPILAAPQHYGSAEETPLNKLPLAMVYRAVLSLVQGLDDEPAAPNVVLINHSVCDANGHFSKRMTPWARLLDYLSHQFNLLFIVSAGNVESPIPISEFSNKTGFDGCDETKRQFALMAALERAKDARRLLSPAESVNSLSVGAVHADAAGACPVGQIDPFQKIGMISLCSGLGLGFRDTVKPDLLAEGGRLVAVAQRSAGGLTVHGRRIQQLGHLAAAPSKTGDTSHLSRASGTSNAAALTTRAGLLLADAIEDVFRTDRIDWITLRTRAVILKALLTHGCDWGGNDGIGGVLDKTIQLKETWQERRKTITKFLGFGTPDLERILGEDGHRVTLLGEDEIMPEELHEYRLPIPIQMVKNRELRRITVTLAWTSPIVPNLSSNYRAIGLDVVDKDGGRKFWKGFEASGGQPLQPHPDRARRGTLIHFTLEGKKFADFTEDDGLFIGVQAKTPLTAFAKERVPYALAVTLELVDNIHVPIYTEVRKKLRQRASNRQSVRV